jgi:hypothetical protein
MMIAALSLALIGCDARDSRPFDASAGDTGKVGLRGHGRRT